MGRYLSIAILGLAGALSASVIPQFIALVLAIISNFTPLLNNTRGQLSLVLLLVICWSMRSSLLDSLVWALVGGIVLDLLSVLPLGTSSIALLLIAYASNGIAQQVYRLRIPVILMITLFATIFFITYTFVALLLLGFSYDIPSLLGLVLLPTVIYNLVAVLPVYLFVRLIQRRLEGGLQMAPQSLAGGRDLRSSV